MNIRTKIKEAIQIIASFICLFICKLSGTEVGAVVNDSPMDCLAANDRGLQAESQVPSSAPLKKALDSSSAFFNEIRLQRVKYLADTKKLRYEIFVWQI